MQDEELRQAVRQDLTMARLAVVKHVRESGGDPRSEAPDRSELVYAADQIVRWGNLERSLLHDNCRSLFPELKEDTAKVFFDDLFPRLESTLNPAAD